MAQVDLVEFIADVSYFSVPDLAELIKKQGKYSPVLMAFGVLVRSVGDQENTGFAGSKNQKPWCRFYRFTLKLKQPAVKLF